MQLKMTISSAQARSLGPEAAARFQQRGGTIGRSRDNDWILPDPERIVSGQHARILYERGTYYVEDTSANGTFLNQADTPLPKGQPVALNHGDTLYAGDYQIQVELVEEPPRTSAFGIELEQSDSAGGEFVARPYVPQTGLGEAGGRDVGGERWPDDRSIPPRPEDHAPGFERQQGVGEAQIQADHLPADKQHFRPPGAKPELIPEDVPPPVSEVLPEDWWEMDEESVHPLEPPQAPTRQPPLSGPATPSAKEPVAPPASEGPLPDQPATSPEQPLPAAQPSAPFEPQQTPAGPPATDRVPPATGESQRLVAAFFEGLDLSPATLSQEEEELLMRQTGRLLRLLAQGTLEVLQARSKLKGEFRLSQTVVRPSENNPLKFSLHADQALRELFIERRPGFLGPEAAFAEALKDIKQHEIAVVAGMRAAFDCLLRKLAPEAVEVALRASGKRASKLRFGDKTWDFYRSFYADFKANAGDDFQGIFGEDFVRAYEEQIALLSVREREG